MVAMFSSVNAGSLLQDRSILFFGDSNMRSLYKDLVWLLEFGSLISPTALRKKNENSFADDIRLSNSELTNSCDYEEIREYHKADVYLRFEFLTRIFQKRFTRAIETLRDFPKIVVINSCLWDISRYGPNGIDEFKVNIEDTFRFLKTFLKSTKIIWITTLPPSPKCRGGFLSENARYTQSLLPFHVVQANDYAAKLAKKYNIDVLDFHYHFKFLIDMRSSDGIHWEPGPVRYMTNLLLTHIDISICSGGLLPFDHTFLNTPLRNDYTSDTIFWFDSNNVNFSNTIISKCANKRRRKLKSRGKINL